MAHNVYECMFIFDSNAYARDPGGVSGRIPKMVEKCGGDLLASRLWFEQRLAYPIKGHKKGTYWLAFVRLESGKLTEFNRECQLDDNILRNLTLRVDPRMVDVRVAQASGERLPFAPPIVEQKPTGAAVRPDDADLEADADDEEDLP